MATERASDSSALLQSITISIKDDDESIRRILESGIRQVEWDENSDTLLLLTKEEEASSNWNTILRVDPATGFVSALYNLSELLEVEDLDIGGISIGPEANQVWVTGSFWQSMYLIELVDDGASDSSTAVFRSKTKVH